MATTIMRSTANRAVHLKIHPRPMDLEQSREILKLITRFGEVEYYRSLKYDELTHPDAALVIFKHEKEAWDFQKSAPIRFRMGRAGPKEEPNEPDQSEGRTHLFESKSEEPSEMGPREAPAPFGMAQTRSTTTAPNDIPRAPPRSSAIPLQRERVESDSLIDSRIFQIITSPARYGFRDQINFGPFHGSFHPQARTYVQKSLGSVVPLRGLGRIDYAAPSPKWKTVYAAKEAEHEGPNRRIPLQELYEARSKATEPT
jgi:hypothetical protein